MSVFAIGDKDTVLGITIAGGNGAVAESADAAASALDAALERDDLALILVTRDVAEPMRERMNRLRMTSLHPIVMEIPGKSLQPSRRSLDELVKRAIGLSV